MKVLSSTKLQVTAPRHPAGVVNLRVRTSAGTSTSQTEAHFRFVAPPAVRSVSPADGSVAGGQRVRISGSNFTHVSTVRFGSLNGSALHVSSTKLLYVTAPAHASGAVKIRVKTSYGTSPTVRANRFSYWSDTLAAGQTLTAGQALWSTTGAYVALMQADGNFVVYASGGRAMWATDTSSADSFIGMQGDGNLVVYAPGGAARWSSATAPSASNRLVMQNDGNLVIYSEGGIPLWDIHSGHFNTPDVLKAGQTLAAGQSLWSDDGHYQAVMQGDGNFVVYDPDRRAVWATDTGSAGSTITMQGDGNLVVYTAGGGAMWSSSTAPTSDARLAMQDDGNLVIYASSSAAVWALGKKLTSGGGNFDGFYAAHPPGSSIDSAFGTQCTTLLVHYLSDVYGERITQWNGSDYISGRKGDLSGLGWTWHAGTGNYRQGDILVWSYSAGSSNGHVAIWYNGQLYEQNAHGTSTSNSGISLDPLSWMRRSTFAGYWERG